MSRQKLTVLGATGSIGKSTLAVVAAHPEKYQVFALTGFSQIDVLAQQCQQFQPQFAVVGSEQVANELKARLGDDSPVQVLWGEQALVDVASAPEVDMVMAAIVGVAGLMPTWAAVQKGKRILLANKETLVVAGALFMNAAKCSGAKVLPVDSEHNAIFQSLPVQFTDGLASVGVSSIILTASGGPFLHRSAQDFDVITPEEAVAHPNWQMGRKISVDSASMMNKGLEVIEAHWLFGVAADKIEVLIHPQSIVHSMVRFIDGSVVAQLGTPDMRTPIAYCMAYPERIDSQVAALDFTQISALTFTHPDLEKFVCLRLAFDALKAGGDACCVLNAANEVAVEAFLNKKIRFSDIPRLVEAGLGQIDLQASSNINDLLDKDRQTRYYINCLLEKEFLC